MFCSGRRSVVDIGQGGVQPRAWLIERRSVRRARWVCYASACLLCLFGFTGCTSAEDETLEDLSEQNNRTHKAVADRAKGFWAKNVSLVHRSGDELLLKLTADNIVHRRRTTKLFVYQNYDEIFLRGLRVDFPLIEQGRGRQRIKLPLREIEEGLRGISESSSPAETASPEADQPEVDVLSRVQIDEVFFRMLPHGQGPIELSARQAKISGDFKAILFEGGVKLLSRKCNIEAPKAIWSSEHDGLLFPTGYSENRKRRFGKVFLSLRASGLCQKVSPVPQVAYVDLLEEQEAALYASISQHVPAYARFMLGIGIPTTHRH